MNYIESEKDYNERVKEIREVRAQLITLCEKNLALLSGMVQYIVDTSNNEYTPDEYEALSLFAKTRTELHEMKMAFDMAYREDYWQRNPDIDPRPLVVFAPRS